MSDHWETFPCMLSNHQAFITYDHGIRSELEGLPFANCARFEIMLKNPDDRGLPHGEEFSWLNNIEDHLSKCFTEAAVSVGRITTNGRRYVFFYTSHDEAKTLAIALETAGIHGYMISLEQSHDLERSRYWNELFPTDDDWQVIQDMRLEDSLVNAGDSLIHPRKIEHWAYFHNTVDRQQFADAVADHFTDIELYEAPDSGRGSFVAKLSHNNLPDYRSMNKYTILLGRQAKNSGGDYDGWEALVCKDA